MNLKKNAITLAAAAALTVAASAGWSQEGPSPSKDAPRALLSSADGSMQVSNPVFQNLEGGQPVLCQSFEGIDSWDDIDDTDNIVIELDIGAGNELTGVGWDIGIATVGASWRSEATILHSDSTGSADPNGINLNVGQADASSGDTDYSSGGAIVVFADNMLPNVVAGADGILRLEMFESFDDNADDIDANYRNAAMPALCAGLALQCSDQAACNAAVSGLPQTRAVPVNSPWAMGLMVLLLAGLGVVAIRRFA